MSCIFCFLFSSFFNGSIGLSPLAISSCVRLPIATELDGKLPTAHWQLELVTHLFLYICGTYPSLTLWTPAFWHLRRPILYLLASYGALATKSYILQWTLKSFSFMVQSHQLSFFQMLFEFLAGSAILLISLHTHTHTHAYIRPQILIPTYIHTPPHSHVQLHKDTYTHTSVHTHQHQLRHAHPLINIFSHRYGHPFIIILTNLPIWSCSQIYAYVLGHVSTK